MKSKKAALGPQNAEWIIALALIALAIMFYQNQATEKKTLLIEFNSRDATHLTLQRTLLNLLQTPVPLKDQTLSFGELLAYRELDEQYEPLILSTLSKYAPDLQVTLQSGTNIVAQYGKVSSTSAQVVSSQIPSFTGKPLTVLLKRADLQ